ncbi:MAG: hypothetical protein QNJ68_08380 [Microcoleaceae cyanobacterium MO_207.B10]|nr:hypothetical protein [Microcoleaceae cyanobacterium MO_207.B10]
MNSSANHSFDTNKYPVSHQAKLSEQTIAQSDVTPSIARPNNHPISEGPVNQINEFPDENMALELEQADDKLATRDTQPLNSPESNNLKNKKTDAPDQDSTIVRQHPIAPPSEPKQYRAIGLVRGRYQPSTEQFTRGNLQTPDGSEIDAVLLGRVMSLLKNHLDLETEHLWVVYPRTRQQNDDLHLQIMGVWEPETLKRSEVPDNLSISTVEESDSVTLTSTPENSESKETLTEQENKASSAQDESEQVLHNESTERENALDVSDSKNHTIKDGNENIPGGITNQLNVLEALTESSDIGASHDGYFSIRGEVIYQSQDEEYVILKVRQSPRKDEETPKFFKLKLKGSLGDRPINRFWDLHIQRQETSLVIQYANDIGALFINQRKPQPRGNKRFNQRKGNFSRNYRPQSFNSRKNSTPTPKPIRKNKSTDKQE